MKLHLAFIFNALCAHIVSAHMGRWDDACLERNAFIDALQSYRATEILNGNA